MKNRNVIYAAILSALVCLALVPKAQAAPDTALPGFNTADGDHALFSITTGVANTAVGWFSLQSNTDGVASAIARNGWLGFKSSTRLQSLTTASELCALFSPRQWIAAHVSEIRRLISRAYGFARSDWSYRREKSSCGS